MQCKISSKIDETKDARGLLQQNSTQRIDWSGLPMNDLHQFMSPHMHGSVPAVTSARAPSQYQVI